MAFAPHPPLATSAQRARSLAGPSGASTSTRAAPTRLPSAATCPAGGSGAGARRILRHGELIVAGEERPLHHPQPPLRHADRRLFQKELLRHHVGLGGVAELELGESRVGAPDELLHLGRRATLDEGLAIGGA